ncbi:MAG TPA: enoyl-CoA hydratase-related protein [Baekduia sp.]|uniref:enoyl-CoA hydratase-related protein n=1 Tax=Baekduia sp. TaxID=2600305 RepID=UPI002D7727CF|nr:enoyl-CoA hydratase-related protein [Baekduia sp.]HET6506244.1 enoyl-CoA hydratase-related protein [Baekduia sp.]
MPTLDRDGDVFLLNLGDDENRFNPEWVGAVGALLDEVAAAPSPRALVTTATGKIWSNGLDLDWMGQNASEIPAFVPTVHALFGKMLALPVPTVAAIQGHCFAAGAMLAVAHDFRVMRADRGFFCLPEVDINIPFTPPMAALIQARLSKAAAHEAMTTGRRYGGADAAAAGIVDDAVGEDAVLPRAIERAAALAGKNGATLGAIKKGMYAEALALLRDPTPIAFG